MAIQINTARVSSVANYINDANKKIRDEISDLDTAIRLLERNWEGEASSSCVNKYDHLKRSFSDSRFSVVNGLVSFMRIQVEEGYEATEKSISNAAAAFE